jgi:hypothetical protein
MKEHFEAFKHHVFVTKHQPPQKQEYYNYGATQTELLEAYKLQPSLILLSPITTQCSTQ